MTPDLKAHWHDLADDEELMLAELPPTRATCARCGAGELEHFYPEQLDTEASEEEAESDWFGPAEELSTSYRL